jgi:acyl-CoA reductase-like NAD-dependent aldehyde dehydrogenase
VKDPYNGELLADVANCDVQDAQMVKFYIDTICLINDYRKFQAVAAARKAFYKWSWETTAKERASVLRKWYEVCTAKENELAEILTREQVLLIHMLFILLICSQYSEIYLIR